MRLWHYDLIKVLPTSQLKAMRYEIGNMVKQYPNIKNRLVSYVNNRDIRCILPYFLSVLDEFDKRKINHNNNYDEKIYDLIQKKSEFAITKLGATYTEHNIRYLTQCYYNLQEKYDRGMISEEEWLRIDECYQKLTIKG